MIKARTALSLALAAFFAPCALLTSDLHADFVTLIPAMDNTIFQDGALSNAKGSIFAGETSFTADFSLRRGLIQFDIASPIPAGATIENVSLTLIATRSVFGGEATLHR